MHDAPRSAAERPYCSSSAGISGCRRSRPQRKARCGAALPSLPRIGARTTASVTIPTGSPSSLGSSMAWAVGSTIPIREEPSPTVVRRTSSTSWPPRKRTTAGCARWTRRRSEGSPRTSTTSPWRVRGVNRHQKSGKDAGEWLPERNLCWFANQVVSVKRKYSLSVDSRERNALERVLSGCSSTVMDILDTGGAPRADASVQEAPVPAPSLMPDPVTPPPVRPQPEARPKERENRDGVERPWSADELARRLFQTWNNRSPQETEGDRSEISLAEGIAH